MFKSGDPLEAVKNLRVHLQEAMDIHIRLKADLCMIPIIDTLGTRDPLFTIELARYRTLLTNATSTLTHDPEDCAVVLDEMLRDTVSIIKQLNQASKNWEESSARRAAIEAEHHDKVVALEAQIKTLSNRVNNASKNPNNHNRFSGSGGLSTSKKGYCQAVHCNNKIEKWTSKNNWMSK